MNRGIKGTSKQIGQRTFSISGTKTISTDSQSIDSSTDFGKFDPSFTKNLKLKIIYENIETKLILQCYLEKTYRSFELG